MTYEYYFDIGEIQAAVPYYFSSVGTTVESPLNLQTGLIMINKVRFGNCKVINIDGSLNRTVGVGYSLENGNSEGFFNVGDAGLGGQLPSSYDAYKLTVQPNPGTATRQSSFYFVTNRYSGDSTSAPLAKHYISVRQCGTDEYLLVFDVSKKNNVKGLWLFASSGMPTGTPASQNYFMPDNRIPVDYVTWHGGSFGNLKVNALSGSAAGTTVAVGSTVYYRVLYDDDSTWAQSVLKSFTLFNSDQKITLL